MSVARAQQEVSSSEFAEWIAYEGISPSHPERGDLYVAQICFWIHRQYLSKSDQKKQKLQDYMFDFEPKKELNDKEQHQENVTQLLSYLGRIDKDG